MTLKASMSKDGNNNNGNSGQKGGDGTDDVPSYLPWIFENPNKEATKQVRGSNMNWCTNDCHKKPMWCGCKKCLNREDYSKAWKEKKDKRVIEEETVEATVIRYWVISN